MQQTNELSSPTSSMLADLPSENFTEPTHLAPQVVDETMFSMWYIREENIRYVLLQYSDTY